MPEWIYFLDCCGGLGAGWPVTLLFTAGWSTRAWNTWQEFGDLMLVCSFPKCGDPNIDPKILIILNIDSPKGTPMLGNPPYLFCRNLRVTKSLEMQGRNLTSLIKVSFSPEVHNSDRLV